MHCARRHISQTSTKMFARINTHLIEIDLRVYVLFYRKEFVLLNPNVTEVQLQTLVTDSQVPHMLLCNSFRSAQKSVCWLTLYFSHKGVVLPRVQTK